MDQGQTRVLHVDDEPDFTDLTATFLEREDDQFSVETATSAAGGLDVISDHPPDCVVSDYNMSGMNGIEFLRAVREECPDLPFILFTGRGSEAVASAAIAADVTDYLQKESGTEQYELLANRIRKAVQARRDAERAERQEQLMRLTEFAGDTGGFELDTETGEVLMTDGTRRILNLPEQANPNFEDNLQYYHPDDRENIRETVQRAVQTGEQTHGTWRYQHPDGEEQLLDVTYTPVTASGDTTTIRGALHDITDRRERQRELRLLQQAIDDANVPITLADPSQPDEPLVYVNDAFEEMTGYPPGETLGRNCRFLQGEDTDSEKTAALRRAIDDEEPATVELRNYRKDGTEFWNRLTVTPIYHDGQLVRYLGTQEDITEQRERQQELESERRFIDQALDTLDDLFYVLDTDGCVRRWNEQLPDVSGYTEAEIEDMQALELFPEDDRETIADAIQVAVSGEKVTVEADLLTADGQRVPYEFTGACLTDEDDTTTGIVGIGRDLTESRQRERRFKALVEESTDIISVLDTDGQVQYQSPSLERVLGYEPEEMLGDTAWEYIHPEDRERAFEQFEEWITDPDQAADLIQYRVRDADGSWRWMEVRASSRFDSPVVEGHVVNSRDITDRKERKRELETVTRQYETLVENFPRGTVSLIDTDCECVRAGGEELNDVGLSPEDVEGEKPHDLFPADIAEELRHYYEEALAGNSHTFHQEYNGERYRVQTVPVRTGTGSIEGLIAVSQNVTGHAEDREQLRRRDEQLSRLHEATRGLFGADSPEQVAEIASRAAVDILDLPLNGIHFYDDAADVLVPVAVSDASREVLGEVPVMDGGIAWETFQHGEFQIYNDVRNASKVYNPETPIRSEMFMPVGNHGVFIISSRQVDAFDDANVELARTLAANTTAALERTCREEELQTQRKELIQKNERLDEFASVVSHDLRSPLTVADGHIELAQEACESDHLARAARAIDRSQALIDDLLTLAREGETVADRELLELADVAQQCWQGVRTEQATLEGTPRQVIEADRSRVRQLFENLYRNAVEHGGENATVRVGSMDGGFYVADTGSGIPESDREQVFESGYSTSDDGTGFGLRIVERIAEAHGWEVSVTESEQGGARFEVTNVASSQP